MKLVLFQCEVGFVSMWSILRGWEGITRHTSKGDFFLRCKKTFVSLNGVQGRYVRPKRPNKYRKCVYKSPNKIINQSIRHSYQMLTAQILWKNNIFSFILRALQTLQVHRNGHYYWYIVYSCFKNKSASKAIPVDYNTFVNAVNMKYWIEGCKAMWTQHKSLESTPKLCNTSLLIFYITPVS